VRFLLDTNIVIHAYDGNDRVLEKLLERDGSLLISTLCLAELRRGIHRLPDAALTRRQRLDAILRRIPSLPFDSAAVDAYDRIIEKCGFTRGRDFDRMIAAHAMSIGAVLVTDNTEDFSDIPALMLENWMEI
jgi:tRNA(fMet)-specific endonuclease VapC